MGDSNNMDKRNNNTHKQQTIETITIYYMYIKNKSLPTHETNGEHAKQHKTYTTHNTENTVYICIYE